MPPEWSTLLTRAVRVAVVAAPLFPALAIATLSLRMLLVDQGTERAVAVLARVAFVGSMIAAIVATAALVALEVPSGLPTTTAIEVPLGTWFHAGHHGFDFALRYDGTGAVMLLLTTAITGLIGRFSVTYLHREPGFARFFLLLLVFAAGMQLQVLAASFDVLFIGWEFVGFASVLLVAFFHERPQPVRAAMRLFIVYRLCDVGLLVGIALLHKFGHGSAVGDLEHQTLTERQSTAVALLFLLAAMGKSALFPVGGWLPRAMEGPTPSSALFYGALSVHAGAYLMLRAGPLLDGAPVARVAVIVVGGLTAAVGTMAWRVQTDAKSALAFATMTQVGFIFVEVGLGLRQIALVHVVGHAGVRAWQMLRAPSVLREAALLRAAHGGRLPPAPWDALASRAFEALPVSVQRALFRLALDRFQLEAFENFLVAPVRAAAEAIGREERRLAAWVRGDRPDTARTEAVPPFGPGPDGPGDGPRRSTAKEPHG